MGARSILGLGSKKKVMQSDLLDEASDRIYEGGRKTGSSTAHADIATLEQLAARAAKGDKAATYELCHLIAKQVLFRTRCMIKSRSDAEDAAQEVLLRVCSKIQELKNPEAFRGWLNTIIMNETRRILTKSIRNNDVLDIAEYSDAVITEDKDLLPEEYILQEEDCNEIMNIIIALPEQQREAIVLHYFESFSVGETAKAMGASQGNISRALKQARAKIKNELAELDCRTEAVGAGLAALPVGSLATEVMRQKASRINPEDILWMEQALTTCKAHLFGAAVPLAAAAAVGATKTIGTFLAMGATVMAGIAATVAVSSVVVFMGVPSDEVVQEPSTFIEGELSFSGNGGSEHINPQKVAISAESTTGTMTVVSWEIKESESGVVRYRGEGNSVDKTLSDMTERGEEGRYTLEVYMSAEDGYDGWLSRKFEIRTDD